MNSLKTLFATIVLCFLCSGCWTARIDKIPLHTGEIPFTVPPGAEITDSKGQLHVIENESWVMSQTDVYDYMRYIRKLSTEKEPITSSIENKFAKINKNYIIYFLGVAAVVFLSCFFVVRSKLRKLKKLLSNSNTNDDSEEDYAS